MVSHGNHFTRDTPYGFRDEKNNCSQGEIKAPHHAVTHSCALDPGGAQWSTCIGVDAG